MRFKLFLASLLACGFIAYVIANENISSEIESVSKDAKLNKDNNLKTASAATVLNKNDAVEMFEVIEDPKPKRQPKIAKTSTVNNVVVANNMSTLQRSGALQMFDDYLGELGYEVTDNGYNWGK